MTLQKSLFRAYVPHDAFVRHIHPVVKMAIVLALNLVTLWATDLYSTFLFLLICLGLVIVSRSPFAAIKGFLFTLIGLMQLLTLSYVFLTVRPGQVTYFEREIVLLSTSGGEWVWHILISDRTLREALALDMRLVALFLATAFFMVSTNDRDIVYGLRKLRFPFAAALLVALVFRAISLAVDDFYAVRDAMRSKGADFEHGPLWRRLRRYVYLLLPLFVLGVRRSEEISMALESRGIPIRRAGRSVYHAFPFQAHDWALLGGATALVAATLLLPPLAGVSIGYPLAWLAQTLTGR